MMNYNYLESMKEDIKEYIKNDSDFTIDELINNRSELEQKLNEDLWITDSVTGNASGSYTFNRCKAKECVESNMDLLQEMCNEFCVDSKTIGEKFLQGEWEWMDVSIRCYLLGQAISKVLDDIENEQED